MTQAIILAGGRGERLRPLTDSIPKPMAPVGGFPFLVHLIRQLRRHGVTDIVVLAGYLSGVVEQYFRDHPLEDEGVTVKVVSSSPSLSPGQRLLSAVNLLEPEFLLLYGDNYARFSLEKLRLRQSQSSAATVMSVSKKSPGDLRLDESGAVTDMSQGGRTEHFRFVEVGYILTRKDSLCAQLIRSRGDLRKALASQVEQGLAAAEEIEHPYFSISDPVRLAKTTRALSDRKVLFLEWDGVLANSSSEMSRAKRNNQPSSQERNWRAVEQLASEGFSFVIISGGVGGGVTRTQSGELTELSDAIRAKFVASRAQLLGIYSCSGETVEFGDGWDRNPYPLYRAATNNDLILDNIIVVGTQASDWETVTAAGVFPIMIGKNTGHNGKASFETLLEALPLVRSHYGPERDIGFL